MYRGILPCNFIFLCFIFPRRFFFILGNPLLPPVFAKYSCSY
uniref:Uncharacterized protein n=1 Tax=Rhizophora mucronata TaxID=61149 RepID=A0A2P2PUU1_RHIMU